MLDAQGYLSRVVAPGHYYAFAFKRPGWTGLSHRFFLQADIAAAVSWLNRLAPTYDIWVGVASYRDADKTGVDATGQRFKGKRTQANAEALRCFWYDADIARPNDGKTVDRVWSDDLEIVRWLARAKREHGLPSPNTWIRSGYGLHLYWVLDSAIPADQWLPHGQAFRALLLKAGARGDIGVSGDSARIMRLPDTFNHKVPASPAPCWDKTPPQIGASHVYLTSDFLNLLKTTGSSSLSSLSAPPPSTRVSQLNANAQAGINHPPPYDFNRIAASCPQVARTMLEEGKHDPYSLWHLMVNMAYACRDQEAAHRLGCKHIKYSRSDTDAKWAQTEREHQVKDFGAPSCATIDAARPGVCNTCPHRGKITTPYSMGKPVLQGVVLPSGYRIGSNEIERRGGEGNDDWTPLIHGIVDDVHLLRTSPNTFHLKFNYILSGKVHHVGLNESDLYISPDRLRQTLVRNGISVNHFNATNFGKFLMAWIDELRKATDKVIDAPPPFGWVIDETGNHTGLCVSGIFYHTDGTQTPAQPGDKVIHKHYQPRGSIEKWREVAKFVTDKRPDLQVLVAASFAAPLMEFIGESPVLSVWSRNSGARKTSAFRVGTSVWCDPIVGMSSLRDTTNSVQHSLGETKIMPVYWDEVMAGNREQITTMTDNIFNITQGRGKSRLDSNIEQRDVGRWQTMMFLSANRPLGELIEKERAHTNAGTLRIFEYQMEPRGGQAVLEAPMIVDQYRYNYGHAGREFVQWVVQHIAEIKSFIKTLRKRLGRDLKINDPNERFHVAAVLGIVTGAAFATDLKLVEFDVRGIYRFLLSKMLEQRIERHEENPIADEPKHLSMTFERFVSDLTDETIASQSFAPVGRSTVGLPDRVKIISRPGPLCKRAMIHIGLNEGEMRFDHQRFKKWCFDNGLSAKAQIELMTRLWPVTKTRAVLGIGTDWSSGAKVDYYRLPLITPDLKHHLACGTPNPDPGNVVTLPGPPPRR